MKNGTTNYSEIDTAERQGCILSPFLFLLAMDFNIEKAMDDQNCDIRWKRGAHLMDLDWIPPRGKKKRRPCKTWHATFKEDLQLVGVPWRDAESAASCQRR